MKIKLCVLIILGLLLHWSPSFAKKGETLSVVGFCLDEEEFRYITELSERNVNRAQSVFANTCHGFDGRVFTIRLVSKEWEFTDSDGVHYEAWLALWEKDQNTLLPVWVPIVAPLPAPAVTTQVFYRGYLCEKEEDLLRIKDMAAVDIGGAQEYMEINCPLNPPIPVVLGDQEGDFVDEHGNIFRSWSAYRWKDGETGTDPVYFFVKIGEAEEV